MTRNSVTLSQVQRMYLSSISSRQVVECALTIGWIEPSEREVLRLTRRGETARAKTDTRASLKALIVDYIVAEQPTWALLASLGRRDLLLQAPRGVVQVFVEAGLAYGYDEPTVQFWDSLAAEARNNETSNLVGVGRQGERLSYAKELDRTGHAPKWVSIDSNADGYDILSRVSHEDSTRLLIEVKASQRPIDWATLHLSRNEWQIATQSKNHVFHLWASVDTQPKFAALTTSQLSVHVARESGEGRWESMEIPYRAFKDYFHSASRST